MHALKQGRTGGRTPGVAGDHAFTPLVTQAPVPCPTRHDRSNEDQQCGNWLTACRTGPGLRQAHHVRCARRLFCGTKRRPSKHARPGPCARHRYAQVANSTFDPQSSAMCLVDMVDMNAGLAS